MNTYEGEVYVIRLLCCSSHFPDKSSKSYDEGDVIYATKWSNYAFLMGMLIIITSCLMYIALAFALSGPELRGGHSY